FYKSSSETTGPFPFMSSQFQTYAQPEIDVSENEEDLEIKTNDEEEVKTANNKEANDNKINIH
ncbi:1306_t:CDS:2, partial [Funneliformis mosseae]